MSQPGPSRLELLVQALAARLELVEQDNRDLRERVARLEAEGYVLVQGEQEKPARSHSLAGGSAPGPTSTSSPRPASAAASGLLLPRRALQRHPRRAFASRWLTRSGLTSDAAYRGTTVAAVDEKRSIWPTGSTWSRAIRTTRCTTPCAFSTPGGTPNLW